MLICKKTSKTALEILVLITQPKNGLMKIVWPTVFRGIEQPDEEYPSQALKKLQEKFSSEYSNPFQKLKQISEMGIDKEAMDFLEKPLRGSWKGSVDKTGLSLKYMEERMNTFVLNYPFGAEGMIDAKMRSFDLELYLDIKNKTKVSENELTLNYRSWLAKKAGAETTLIENNYIGEWGNLHCEIESKNADYLRRDETVAFLPFSHYDASKKFDMEKHNRETFLEMYEGEYANFKGYSVLIAYGKLIAIKQTMKEIEPIIECLKLYDGEFLKAELNRETFAELYSKK